MLHSVKDGQCIGGLVHQQSRRYQVKSSSGPSQGFFTLLPEQKGRHGGISSGNAQLHSRLKFRVSEGLQCMETESNTVSNYLGQMGSLSGGLVCVLPRPSTSPIFQFEARPRSSGDGCIHARLEWVPGVCISPLLRDYQVNSPDQAAKGVFSTGNSGLEVSSMVASSSGTFCGFSNPSSPDSEYKAQYQDGSLSILSRSSQALCGPLPPGICVVH